MLEKISMKMTDLCGKNMNLTEAERLTMFFGFENMNHQIFLYSVIGMSAFCLGIFGWTLLFTVVFSILRLYAGGCHLKTSAGCTFVTTLLMIGGTEIALKMDGSLLVMNILFIVSFMLVLILAPRRTENYPVSEREYMKLKKESAGIVIGCWVLAIISPDVFGKMIAMAVLTEAVTLIPKPHASCVRVSRNRLSW